MEKRQLQPGFARFLDNRAEKAKNKSAQGIQTRQAVTQFPVMTNPAHHASRVFFMLDFFRLMAESLTGIDDPSNPFFGQGGT